MDNGWVGKHLDLPPVRLLGKDLGAMPELAVAQFLPKPHRAAGKGAAEIGGITACMVAMEIAMGQPIR